MRTNPEISVPNRTKPQQIIGGVSCVVRDRSFKEPCYAVISAGELLAVRFADQLQAMEHLNGMLTGAKP